MATKATIRQARYDATHMKPYYFKLHIVNDADIIDQLEKVDSRQGYIKQLIRDDIARTRPGSVPESAPKKMKLDDIYSFLQEQADMQPEKYDGMYDILNALNGKMMGYTPGEG